MPQNVTLILSAERDSQELAEFTAGCLADLVDTDELMACSVPTVTRPGERSIDAVALGQLSLGFLNAGAVVALVKCLGGWFEREKTLSIKITKADGSIYELSAKNLKQPDIDATIENLSQFVDS